MKLRAGNVTILLAALIIGVSASSEEELWCYHCNAGVSTGVHETECNDPYSPRSVDLVRCPQNETHACLKSLVFYKHVDVTVRSCVPAIQKSTYCSVENAYPDALIECQFCDDNACNASPPIGKSSTQRFFVISFILTTFVSRFLRFC